jgi:hypothetical protein
LGQQNRNTDKYSNKNSGLYFFLGPVRSATIL